LLLLLPQGLLLLLLDLLRSSRLLLLQLLLLGLLHAVLLQLRDACLHQGQCPAVQAHHDLPYIVIGHWPAAEAVVPVTPRPGVF
jgi:hypothetical protein